MYRTIQLKDLIVRDAQGTILGHVCGLEAAGPGLLTLRRQLLDEAGTPYVREETGPFTLLVRVASDPPDPATLAMPPALVPETPIQPRAEGA